MADCCPLQNHQNADRLSIGVERETVRFYRLSGSEYPKGAFGKCWLPDGKSEFDQIKEPAKRLVNQKIPGYATILNVDSTKCVIISEFISLDGERPAPSLHDKVKQKKLFPADAWLVLMQIVTCAVAFERKFPNENLHLYLDFHPTNVLIEDDKSLQVRVVDLRATPLENENALIHQIGKLFYYLLTADGRIFESNERQNIIKENVENLSSDQEVREEIRSFLSKCGVLRTDDDKFKSIEELNEYVATKMRDTSRPAYALPPVYTYGFFYSVILFIIACLSLILVGVAGHQGGLTFWQMVGFAPLPSATPTPTSTAIPTMRPILTATPTTTPTSTATSTTTPTSTATSTTTPTSTATPTTTPTSTATLTATSTPTPTPTPTHIPSPSPPPGSIPPLMPSSSPCSSPYVQIDYPYDNQTIVTARGVTIWGTAKFPTDLKGEYGNRSFDRFKLEFRRTNRFPTGWTSIHEGVSTKHHDILGELTLSMLQEKYPPPKNLPIEDVPTYYSGRYMLRLRIVDNTANYDWDGIEDCIISFELQFK